MLPNVVSDCGCMLLLELGEPVQLDNPIKIITHIVEDKVNITIEDKGKGIASDSLSQVFEPFYREDQARQRQTGGTGLGSYLVKLVVDVHKGTITIYSKKAKDTKVSIMLSKTPLGVDPLPS